MRLNVDLHRRAPGGLDRKTPFAPCIVSAFERTHTRDSHAAKFERRTGAGGFVWSSAVKDHIAIAGDLVAMQPQFLAIEPHRAGEFHAVQFQLN
jgi:hypothetical protein